MSADGRFGPNTAQVEQFLQAIRDATPEQWAAARDAARTAAWDAAWSAARAAAWSAAWSAAADAAADAARDAAWSAAWAAAAIVVRDLIADEDYELLTEPMRTAGILPEDLQ